MQLWRNHSLTIVLLTTGAAVYGVALRFEPGRTWDTLSTIGLGLILLGGVNILQGPLRERNRPEK